MNKWASGGITPSSDLVIGSLNDVFGGSYATSIRGLHALKFTGGLPATIGRSMQRLAGTPLIPLNEGEV